MGEGGDGTPPAIRCEGDELSVIGPGSVLGRQQPNRYNLPCVFLFRKYHILVFWRQHYPC